MTGKNEIRGDMRARRKAVLPAEKASVAAAVCERVLMHPGIAAALDPANRRGALAVYLATPDEIDLSVVIAEMFVRGVMIVAPRWNGETYELARLKGLGDGYLRKGPMGVMEPKDAEIIASKDVSVWLVPGLAFTRCGERLGYGGGWYDRLLAAADPRSLKLGVAYSFQIVEGLPSEPHDLRVDGII